MTTTGPPPPVLDAQTAAFIQLFVSMNLATRDSALKPAVTRAYGCRVTPDLKSITLFISRAHNQQVLDNINATRNIAAVFSRPSTHQTLQLKGMDARLVDIAATDHAVINAYRQSFIEELKNLGYPPGFTETMVPPLATLDTGICFTPLEVFIQTPGPQAGMKIST